MSLFLTKESTADLKSPFHTLLCHREDLNLLYLTHDFIKFLQSSWCWQFLLNSNLIIVSRGRQKSVMAPKIPDPSPHHTPSPSCTSPHNPLDCEYDYCMLYNRVDFLEREIIRGESDLIRWALKRDHVLPGVRDCVKRIRDLNWGSLGCWFWRWR